MLYTLVHYSSSKHIRIVTSGGVCPVYNFLYLEPCTVSTILKEQMCYNVLLMPVKDSKLNWTVTKASDNAVYRRHGDRTGGVWVMQQH
jgi:hypothetical protein